MKVLPRESLPYDISHIGLIQSYLDLGETEFAAKLAMDVAEEFNSMVTYYIYKRRRDREFTKYYSGLNYLPSILLRAGLVEESEKIRQMAEEQKARVELMDRRNL